MKLLFFIFYVFYFCDLNAQSGVYVNEPKNTDGAKIKWILTLNQDGTFLYHFFRDVSAISKPNKEENFYGKGTWVLEGKIVILSSNKSEDLDSTYTVNLNNSKARYITKSPRDISDKVVKPSLRFYESETFHIKGLELYKE